MNVSALWNVTGMLLPFPWNFIGTYYRVYSDCGNTGQICLRTLYMTLGTPQFHR
jgi:hypothetical protein